MLKKIRVTQLVVGMHLNEFFGSWVEHSFWRTAFVITDPADIEAILASSIKEVWIDSSKGLDVQQGEHVVTTVESEAQIEAALNLTAQAIRQKSLVSVATEIERATKICAQSKRALTSMFNESLMGNAVNTSAAQKLVEEISASISRNAGALISLACLKLPTTILTCTRLPFSR